MVIDKNTAGGTVASIFFHWQKISTADSFLQPGTFNFVQQNLITNKGHECSQHKADGGDYQFLIQ